jgi:hypothetical protein
MAALRRGARALLLAMTVMPAAVAFAEEPKPDAPQRGTPDAPKAEGAAPDGQGAETKPSEVIRQTVELLDPGKKPLERLRYAPKPGTEWDVSIVQNTKYEVLVGGQPVQNADSVTSMEATQRIESVSAKGEAKVVVTVRKFRSKAGESSTALTSGLERTQDEHWRLLEGRAATITFDARGLSLAVDVAAFDDLPEELSSMREFLVNFLQSMTVPLPEEPVGVGARWRLRRDVRMMGVTARAEDTFGPLTRSADKRPEAKVRGHMTAEPQDLPAGGHFGMPEGLQCRLTEWKTLEDGGTGSVGLRLDGMGFLGTMDTRNEVTVAGVSSQVELKLTLRNHLKTEVKYGPAATKKPDGK